MNRLRFYHIIFFALITSQLVVGQFKYSKKINGISMVASRDTIGKTSAQSIKEFGSNYVAVMPYAFMPKLDKPHLLFDTKQQWSGETPKGIESDVKTLQSQGLQVMIKPHIWIGGGDFTGDISMTSQNDWVTFQENYKAYIIAFAKLAERNGVTLFCLGTELQNFVVARPGFWCQLIDELRAIYSGKITYAENWDQYQEFVFWDSLDYIGVDAYFPVSDKKSPTLEEIDSAWKPLKIELKSFSTSFQTKVLFTEYGYRSIDYAGKEPWDASRNENPVNEEAQLNLLKGLHQSFWKEDWFAGGFLWKWFPNYDPSSKRHQNRFTVQGKLSEDYLKSFYSDH